MWPIGANAITKYNIAVEDISFEPIDVTTSELETVYAAIRIPTGTEFTLVTDYGRKALLRGNREGIGHGEGDHILVTAVMKNGVYVPNFNDSGRIINGTIFDRLYKPFSG